MGYIVLPCSSVGKESACSAGDPGSIPELGGFPGEGNGNPLQYPCLANLIDRGAWWAAVQFSSVQFSRSVVSDSLRPHESQHARPPCLSPTPGVHANSHPPSR